MTQPTDRSLFPRLSITDTQEEKVKPQQEEERKVSSAFDRTFFQSRQNLTDTTSSLSPFSNRISNPTRERLKGKVRKNSPTQNLDPSTKKQKPSPKPSYKDAVDQLQTKYHPESFEELPKQIQIQENLYTMKKVEGGRWAKTGDSWQVYFTNDDQFVVKVFIGLTDNSLLKRQQMLGTHDARMNFMRTNYLEALRLKVPCANILNLDTLEKDGCVLQERTAPVIITWENKNILTDKEQRQVEQFCAILEKAIANPKNNWELAPKNCGSREDGTIVYFDFSDYPLQCNQWMLFYQAASNWIGKNPAAKRAVSDKLVQMLKIEALTEHHENIRALQKQVSDIVTVK